MLDPEIIRTLAEAAAAADRAVLAQANDTLVEALVLRDNDLTALAGHCQALAERCDALETRAAAMTAERQAALDASASAAEALAGQHAALIDRCAALELRAAAADALAERCAALETQAAAFAIGTDVAALAERFTGLAIDVGGCATQAETDALAGRYAALETTAASLSERCAALGARVLDFDALAEADEAARGTLANDLNAVAAECAALGARCAALETRGPEKGDKGDPGELVVCWDHLGGWKADTESMPRGALCIDDGSTFVALREAFGGPRAEPTSWRCVAAGMGAMSADWAPDNDRILQLEFNYGADREMLRLHMGPLPLPRGLFDSTRAYEAGDTVAHNGAQWMAIGDIPPGGLPPGKVDPARQWEKAWELFAARGKPGRPAGRGAGKEATL